MDVHYRNELDALVAAKAAVDAELRDLREAAAAPGPLQPALSFFPPPTALPAVRTCELLLTSRAAVHMKSGCFT